MPTKHQAGTGQQQALSNYGKRLQSDKAWLIQCMSAKAGRIGAVDEAKVLSHGERVKALYGMFNVSERDCR